MKMRRILLVEDEERDAAALMRELRKENLASALAGSLEEMRERLERESFDCLVLDLSLGDDPFALIEAIPTLNVPVVVYTGNSDPDIIKAVRETGASYVEKPGLDLLVEKIWGAINYRSADDESAAGQRNAQRALRTARPLFASKGALMSVMIGLITTTGGFASWAFHTLSGEVVKAEETKHKFQVIESKIEVMEKTLLKFDGLIDLIREQNRTSIDERKALRDNQTELKADIKDRLDRIERKLDAKLQ
jgi:CheY-like chemotaxis protein